MARKINEQGGIMPKALWDRRYHPFYRMGRDPMPLLPLSGSGTLFEALPDLPFSNEDLPSLDVRPFDVGYQETESKKWVKIERVPLIQLPSKMAGPAFGLSAGLPSQGGSCHAADPALAQGREEDFICRACYATGGRYTYGLNSFCYLARTVWAKKLLAQGGAELLAQALLRNLTHFATRTTLDGSRDGQGVRRRKELGIFGARSGTLMVPELVNRYGIVERMDAVITPFRAREARLTGCRDSRDLFASRRPRDLEIVGFWRWHDSGDIGIGDEQQSLDYLSAIVKVAQACPNVLFWLPTREWIFPRTLQALQAAAQAAPNLTIRCSALHIGDPPPHIPGLAGSTVASKRRLRVDRERRLPIGKFGSFHRVPLDGGGAAYPCPVEADLRYDPGIVQIHKGTGRPTGKLGGWLKPDNCQEARCRVCWTCPSVPVAYIQK